MKIWKALLITIIVLFTATACQGSRDNQIEQNPIRGSYEIEKVPPSNESGSLHGEMIYVPIYSSIFHSKDFRTYDLTATLSIHNIDLENPIKVTKVNYHNTNGDLIKSYVENSLILKPLQTVQIVIQEDNSSGGTGANFIVEWVSESNVNSPIVEAVMISTAGQLGISFVTTGKVIENLSE